MIPNRLVFVIAALGIGAVFILRPDVSWTIQRFVAGSDVAERETALALQKLALEARVAELSPLAAPTPPDAIPAVIYSRYPFNFKGQLLVSAGGREGVAVGAAVTIPVLETASGTKPVFLGRVTDVYRDSALVTTLFDLEFQAAVRFGPDGTDALLTGGSEPKLTLITKQATVPPGAAVYTAAPDLPYGLPVGWARDAHISYDHLFQEASLELPYDLGDLRQVFIHIGEPGTAP